MISAFPRALFALAVVVAAAFGVLRLAPTLAAEGRMMPAPVVDEPQTAATSETAVLAGGCFWGVQGVFQHVAGVINAVSGYAGGEAKTAHYDIVSGGKTGHAEAVQVTFDPSRISYGRILQIYFSVAHDPTQVNRQGPDEGTQYRSAIFPLSVEQERVAKAYIAQLDQAHVLTAPIATKIEVNRTFYAAEPYHQDFMTRNPNYPYIVFHDLPKLAELKRLFPKSYVDQPVLTAARAAK
jgi:peptide-methionine (S)-S-oxide reductase